MIKMKQLTELKWLIETEVMLSIFLV